MVMNGANTTMKKEKIFGATKMKIKAEFNIKFNARGGIESVNDVPLYDIHPSIALAISQSCLERTSWNDKEIKKYKGRGK